MQIGMMSAITPSITNNLYIDSAKIRTISAGILGNNLIEMKVCKKNLKQKKPFAFAKGSNMAGAERLELATPGFGDRCSTN
ncbi:hypothetical protein YERSI8AC_310089 [Enterobacterales bacterium 8AC]|nr:hypothetical protein YERSI8AC_310089 [Enterobacterales bacterium 8AC]